MSEYMFGSIFKRPSRRIANRLDTICREAGGYGLNEVNVQLGTAPGINNGRYQGWFCAPNRGAPFDADLQRRVMDQIEKEFR